MFPIYRDTHEKRWRSLGPQCIDRVHVRCPPGRVEPRYHADRDTHGHADREVDQVFPEEEICRRTEEGTHHGITDDKTRNRSDTPLPRSLG